jgi:hypothetical protein
MNPLKKERIVLGKLLDVCSTCSEVPRIAKGTWDVKYCVAHCHHWIRIQNQRVLIEKLQKESRTKKQVAGL